MRILTFYTCAFSAIMLSSTANAQDRLQKGNLHGTVTHHQNASARVLSKQEQQQPLNHILAKENVMPKGDKVPDLGYWTGQVTIFRDFLERQLPDADSRFGEQAKQIPFSPGVKHDGIYDYKKLTRDDWRALATTYNGFAEFEMICGIKDIAGLTGPSGKFTEQDIKDAQAALEYLKPDCCSDWMDFGKMLHKIEKETVMQRAALTERHNQSKAAKGGTGALIDFHKNDNIAGDPMDKLNQQKAAQLLEQHNVKLDNDNSLKILDPKAFAVNAVKNIKSAIGIG